MHTPGYRYPQRRYPLPLTDLVIRKAAPTDKPQKLFDGGGLYLSVQPNGNKWWRQKYRYAGKEKLRALGVPAMPPTYALLTFVRSQEFRFARWEEIDWQAREWKVPATRMKVGKTLPAHTVPLSSQALTLLEDLRSLTGHTPYLFHKSAGYGDSEVISENAVGKMLNNLGYQGRQCAHGFRASARSILSEQGWSREAMERQLDHKEADSTVAAYARAEHLPERRRMMRAWADTCDALETSAEVTPLHGKSA